MASTATTTNAHAGASHNPRRSPGSGRSTACDGTATAADVAVEEGRGSFFNGRARFRDADL